MNASSAIQHSAAHTEEAMPTSNASAITAPASFSDNVNGAGRTANSSVAATEARRNSSAIPGCPVGNMEKNPCIRRSVGGVVASDHPLASSVPFTLSGNRSLAISRMQRPAR